MTDQIQSLFKDNLKLEQIQSVTLEDIFPANETEYACINKLELYPIEKCISIVTNKKTSYYLLDNMAVLDEPLYLTNKNTVLNFFVLLPKVWNELICR